MKIGGDLAGRAFGPREEAIDARWLMAYAAALGDTDPAYLDTRRPGGIVGHPLFPVCYEWPLAVEVRESTMDAAVLPRGVHATHDLRIHRRARPGDRLRVSARIVRVEARAPGAYLLWRFETVDAAGAPVSTTDYGSLFLGVACDAPPPAADLSRAAARRDAPARAARWSAAVPVAATAAHTYTEGARIWNPIHTDRAVAEAAGLPDIILHGTATLALAVSEVLRHEGLGADAPVSRISCRFGGMVRMPSTLEVRGLARPGVPGLDAAREEDGAIAFEALGADGRPALRDGRLWLGA